MRVKRIWIQQNIQALALRLYLGLSRTSLTGNLMVLPSHSRCICKCSGVPWSPNIAFAASSAVATFFVST